MCDKDLTVFRVSSVPLLPLAILLKLKLNISTNHIIAERYRRSGVTDTAGSFCGPAAVPELGCLDLQFHRDLI